MKSNEGASNGLAASVVIILHKTALRYINGSLFSQVIVGRLHCDDNVVLALAKSFRHINLGLRWEID